MAAPIVAITDGAAPAVAIVHWLRQQGVRAELLEGHSAQDAARLVVARQTDRPRPRVIALFGPAEAADLDGSAAVEVATRWLERLPAIEQRGAAEVLEKHRMEQAPGHEQLSRLLKRAAVSGPKIRRATRGRPRGSDPFVGVGFDAIVAMLLEPDRQWAERALAETVGRSASAVHRVFRELYQRGYLARSRGATRLRDAEMLRDDLLASWRGRIATRTGRALATPRKRPPTQVVLELQSAGERCVLAGTSAYAGPDGLVDAHVTVYGDERALTALGRAGCRESLPGLGNLIVWTPPEQAIFYAPRSVGGVEATNRVVTYLDLATGATDRSQQAASALWSEQ